MRNIERGVLLEQVELAPFTTWKMGGRAEQFYWPHDLSDLSAFIATVPAEVPITFLGLGSNTLVRDGGVKGLVILTQAALKELSLLNLNQVRAEAGVASAQAARFSVKNQLTGIEFLAGVPGSIGGALVMNAGACGGQTWEHIHHVETLDRQGVFRKRFPGEFDIRYRTVLGLPEGEFFVAAIFSLVAGNSELAQQKIREFLDHRANTQPTHLPSCGCVFKNPEGNHASKLIDEAGLKGTKMGGLQISEKHANFMVNIGQARARDAENLIAFVQEKIKKQYGIELHPEVKIIGEE